LMRALQATSERTRRLWVDAENTDYMMRHVPPHTREWLEQHYSVTDLKVLLRETVNDARTPGGGTIRYPLWLINSLYFWDLLENPLDAEHLRDRLTQTEHSRVAPSPMHMPQELRNDIERGVNALVADDLGTAAARFKAALDQGQEAAAQAFCEQWAKAVPRIWVRELEQSHRRLDPLLLSEIEQWELGDVT